jgi:hypothetical protein
MRTQGRLGGLSPHKPFLGSALLRAAFVLMLWSALAIPAALAQSVPTIYAESFRQGAIRITEEAFDTKLTPDNATYRERIKDAAGNDRYELTITPQVLEGTNEITAWRVMLRDLHHSIYRNILLADQEPSAEAKDNLWWLNPNRFSPVPVRARRIMKVDGFYVVIQVQDMHFTPLDSPYLDSMAVHFGFSNSDPRASK